MFRKTPIGVYFLKSTFGGETLVKKNRKEEEIHLPKKAFVFLAIPMLYLAFIGYLSTLHIESLFTYWYTINEGREMATFANPELFVFTLGFIFLNLGAFAVSVRKEWNKKGLVNDGAL